MPFDDYLNKAKDFAKEKHSGQTRMSGEPYYIHPRRVMEIVKKYKDSYKIKQLMAAALLHDTIEDTDTKVEDLERLFGGLVASLVEELTSDKNIIKKVGKKQYLANKMKNMSSWALVIKLSDRLDNVSDLEIADEQFASRYKNETLFILNDLEKNRLLTKTQRRIVDAIREKLYER